MINTSFVSTDSFFTQFLFLRLLFRRLLIVIEQYLFHDPYLLDDWYFYLHF